MTEQQMREYWEKAGGSFEHRGWAQHAVIPADVLFAFLLVIGKPIDMVLHCPACGMQHIDGPDNLHVWDGRDQSGRNHVSNEGPGAWSNPPHRSHLCHGCGHVWRPADVPTNGVAAVNTKGEADSPIAVPARQAPAGAAGEHYDEVRATLTGLHALCENISAIERRVGPLGSHARGYTHKITAALRHLDALGAAPTPALAQPTTHKPIKWEVAASDIHRTLESKFQCGYSGVFVQEVGGRLTPLIGTAACALRTESPGTKVYARRKLRGVGVWTWMVAEVPKGGA